MRMQSQSRQGAGGAAISGRETPDTLAPADQAKAGTPPTGEALCRACGGSGRDPERRPCENCGGTGKVTIGIGGA